MTLTAAAQPARAHLSIGEVLAALREEFPDITLSKIRFLEAEGLIEPARAPSGYRRFSPDDVQRLRHILTAQRDRYLPLRVIKERLDAGDPLVLPPPRVRVADAGPVESGQPPRLSRAELLRASGLDDQRLAELEEYGLVERLGRDYEAGAVTVAAAAAALAEFGLAPRHLRGIRAAAERHVALIEQVVAPLRRQRGPGAADRAEETAREIATLAGRLHAALVEAGLRGGLNR